ncbi:CcdB family protein [Celeribacter halophilus]|uniref:Toxin CcdB n=1 Tax=Celeribacter halophilus TaxID=576117 RepID=A0A1I3X1B3_9RHOB|nr:CcdB family protein [Celeribacter halophilus]PZX09881.1 toxin CcdB [Celeribacter halophilus]SFK13363.1 toxin CcdB [Celeribacter halophilus]
MARYDVYASPDGAGFLLDVQAELLDDLNTRVVVPLMSVVAAPAPARQLNPVFDIRSERYVMVTQFLSAVPVSILKTSVVSLAKHDREIDGALDMLLTGV